MTHIATDIQEVSDQDALLKTLPLLNLLMTESGLEPVTEEQATNSFEKARQHGYRQFYAQDESGIIAVIGLHAFYDPLEPDLGFEINNLIVTPEKRGQGIGSALFQFAIEIAEKKGGKWIRLMVGEKNEKAITFYEKNKFKKAANLMLREE